MNANQSLRKSEPASFRLRMREASRQRWTVERERGVFHLFAQTVRTTFSWGIAAFLISMVAVPVLLGRPFQPYLIASALAGYCGVTLLITLMVWTVNERRFGTNARLRQ